MRVIYRKIRHARYLYIKRKVKKVWGARYTLGTRYLSKNTVFVNCNWVDTQWQYSTHLHTKYLLTAIGLTPGGSSTVHIYTQTIHRTAQLTNWEECGPCPIFASYTLAFALQLRKKYG